MRLALNVDFGCYAIDPEVEAAVRAAAEALAGAGAVVEEVDLDWGREFADAWVAHWGVYLAAIFGDKLEEGGNDYPVKAMGIDSIAVESWEDTALALEAIIQVS